MVGFVIGFLGLIYYTLRIFGERSAHKSFQRRQNELGEIYVEFLRKVVSPPGVSIEIKNKMNDPAHAEWVRNETEDVLRVLPERPDSHGYKKSDGPYDWTEFYDKLWILMAREGYLLSNYAHCHPFCHPSVANIYRRSNALMKWVCEELARHGLDIVLVDKGHSREFKPRECVFNQSQIVNWEHAVL